ncbi:MAG: hypothetical protein ABSH19_07455, partial [Opitutales bacterium]
HPIPVAILVAFALLASWPGLARAQTGYTQLSNATIATAPYQYCGMVISANATDPLSPFIYNIGGGAIAQDTRLVMSSVYLPYNYGAVSPFTEKNYFAQGYNSTVFPNPVPASAKSLRGYVYGTRYGQLVATGNAFTVAALAVSFAVFYSNTPLTTGTVPAVVDLPGGSLDSSVTKPIVGYAGAANYTLYQTGPITAVPSVISDPLWYFASPMPANIFPFIGGSVWVKESNLWAYEGVALAPGGAVGVPNSTTGQTYTGTVFELMNSANLQLITQALGIIGSGNRTGPPRPTLNATNVYTTLPVDKIANAYQHVQVNNAGTGTLRFNATSSQPWLKVSPTSGVTKTSPVAIALNYDTNSLKAGTYTAVMTVSNTNGVQTVTVLLQVVPVPPPAPNGVRASTNRNDGVLVTWNAVAGAVSYEVYRGSTPQANNPSDLGPATTTNFLDTSAVAQQPYYYFVRTVGPSLVSAYSRAAIGMKRPAAP